MTGCSQEEALAYLDHAGGDVLMAILNNVTCNEPRENAFIPPPRIVDDGLTSECRQRLGEARALSNMFNASSRNDLCSRASAVACPEAPQLAVVPETDEKPSAAASPLQETTAQVLVDAQPSIS